MSKRYDLIALFSFILIILMSACNSNSASTHPSDPSENAAQIVISKTSTPRLTATSTLTSTPTKIPSATPSHTPTALPTSTSTPTLTSTMPPTETPDLAKFGFEEYVHPSSMFKLDMASRDTQVIEFEDAVFFTDGFHLIMVGFTEQEYQLNTTNWMTVTQSFLDQFLIEWSLVTSYDRLERQETGSADNYIIRFNYFSEEAPILEGLGEILFQQQNDITYGLVLLTPEYHDVEFVWGIVKDSFMILEGK